MIGELLVEEGYITQSQFDMARGVQKEKHRRLHSILMDLGYLSEGDLIELLNSKSGVASVELSAFELDPEVLAIVSDKLVRRLEVVPIDRLGNTLTVAMVCPLDEPAKLELEQETGLKVRSVMCSRSDVLRAITRYYGRTEEVVKEYFTRESLGDLDKPLALHKVGAQSGLWTLEGPLKLQRITTLVEEIEELPALPDIVNLIFSVVNDPDSSADDLAEIIGSDVSLSAKILRHANSPYYGFSKKISTIKHAITLLGFRGTQALALSTSLFDDMAGNPAIDFKEYWNHSFKCATLAKSILSSLGRGNSEAAFIGGLLHDVGKILLGTSMPGKYRRLALLCGEGMTPLQAEEELLGITHAEVGFLLAQHWLLPTPIIDAIRYHHHPEFEDASKCQGGIVYLANRFSDERNIKMELETDFDDIVKDVLNKTGMSEDTLKSMLEAYSEIAPEISLF